ncbi:heart- and neural crest derivatives-expressed protein 1 isoform X2 [Drosophila miranda]|uniref:heart- and neural crest derivatives-expressed protein 1 isoform X2 n=1 Tax=Drosophila miranda TaxID=7229 RepID=UPI0007E5EA1D|nr:heart- and neural crest derivatives-expressed protein 1 isoform X2 [Drosophila miranda]
MSKYSNCVGQKSIYYSTVYNGSAVLDIKCSKNNVQEQRYIPINPYGLMATPNVRTIKKRNTANKKERRRTQSINNAFSYLREKIPNVPSDTKLSKNVRVPTNGRTGWPQDVWASELNPDQN